MPITSVGDLVSAFGDLIQSLSDRVTLLEINQAALTARVAALDDGDPTPPDDGGGDNTGGGGQTGGTQTTAVRIDSGGTDSYTDSNNNVWSADEFAVGGDVSDQGAGQDFGTEDDSLYETERYGQFSYHITGMPQGSATLNLLFSENYAGISGTGQRVFNVSINGITVLSDFDIWAVTGQRFKGIVKTFNFTIAADGVVDIVFSNASGNSPLVNAVELLCYGTTTNPGGGGGDGGTGVPPGTTIPIGQFWYTGGSDDSNTQSAQAAYATLKARTNTLQTVYSTRTGGWAAFVASHGTAGQISAYTNKNMVMVLQTSPFPIDVNATYAQLLAGAYDSYWQQIGQLLKNRNAAGYLPVILSPAWEANGTFQAWGGGDGPMKYSSVTQYIQAFQRIVSQVRSKFPGCPVAWTFNSHGTPVEVGTTNTFDFFPGVNFVNYIGIDEYDQYPPSGNNVPDTAWTNRANADGGIAWAAGKVRSLRNSGSDIRLLVPEWGISRAVLNGGGDNPGFIENQLKYYASLFTEGIFFGEYYFGDPVDGVNVDSSLLAAANVNSKNRYVSVFASLNSQFTPSGGTGGGGTTNVLGGSNDFNNHTAYPNTVIIPAPKAIPAGGVSISLNASIQNAINANPNGTQFNLAAGTWSAQGIINPKPGNKFYGVKAGAGGTILSGTYFHRVNSTTTNCEFYNMSLTNTAFISGNANGLGALDSCFGQQQQASGWIAARCEFANNYIGFGIGPNSLVENCTFHDNICKAFSAGEQNTIIRYNQIINNRRTAYNDSIADCAGAKTTVSGPVTYLGNIYTDNGRFAGQWFDGSCHDNVMKDCIFVRNLSSGVTDETGFNNTWDHCIFAGNGIGPENDGWRKTGIVMQSTATDTVKNSFSWSNNGAAYSIYSESRHDANGLARNQNNSVIDCVGDTAVAFYNVNFGSQPPSTVSGYTNKPGSQMVIPALVCGPQPV